ncbi:MAG: SH3 domain-containing protein, partial [Alphaproteobacteria bacterium]|nr:SH3 domain-containing protein [Alphaproteobacteria bacterium]
MTLDPRRNAARPDLADAALEGKVAAQRFVAPIIKRIAPSVAALRRKPRDDAPLDTEGLSGEAVRVFDTTADGWSWVQLEADSYVGYMRSDGLGEASIAAPTHRVVVPRTHVYPAPDIKAPPTGWLPMGAEVAASLHDPRFMRVERGYVIARH